MPKKIEVTSEFTDPFKTKPFSTRGLGLDEKESLSVKSDSQVDSEKSSSSSTTTTTTAATEAVKAQGVAQGVRISAEIRLEPDEETASPSSLYEVQGETIQVPVNSRESKNLQSSTTQATSKDEPKKEESLQSKSLPSMGEVDETTPDSASERSSEPLVKDDPTRIKAEVVNGVEPPVGEARDSASTSHSQSRSQASSSTQSPPPTNEGSVVDDYDERSYAWEEITADSWRRRDASDPVIRTDGRKFEEMLFSIFKL